MSSLLRRVSLVALALAVAGVDASRAAAQGRRPVVRRYQGATSEPTISPYLRLIQPGSDPGLNYFNLVQPQLQQQRNMQLQARQIQGLNRQLIQDERAGPFGATTQIRATGGRAATFQNYSHYYPSLGGPGGGGGGASPVRQLKAAPSTGGGGGMFGGGMGMGMF